jgi:hypothetical protein
MILFNNIYFSNKNNKLASILVIFTIFLIFISKLRPYQNQTLNKRQIITYFIFIVSILGNNFVQTNSNEILNFGIQFSLIILFIVIFFILLKEYLIINYVLMINDLKFNLNSRLRKNIF